MCWEPPDPRAEFLKLKTKIVFLRSKILIFNFFSDRKFFRTKKFSDPKIEKIVFFEKSFFLCFLFDSEKKIGPIVSIFNIIGISECRFENNLECMFENDRLDWKHTFLRKSRRNETKLSRYHMIILTYFCVFMWLEFIFSDCRFGIYLANLEFI